MFSLVRTNIFLCFLKRQIDFAEMSISVLLGRFSYFLHEIDEPFA